ALIVIVELSLRESARGAERALIPGLECLERVEFGPLAFDRRRMPAGAEVRLPARMGIGVFHDGLGSYQPKEERPDRHGREPRLIDGPAIRPASVGIVSFAHGLYVLFLGRRV